MTTVLFVGTDDGIRVASSDDGRSWKVTAPKAPGWAIEKLVTVPGRPGVVLAGTRGDGVWISEDAGGQWRKPCYGKRGPGKVRALTLVDGPDLELYAGCEPIDVFVSKDLGATWECIESLRAHPWIEKVEYPLATVEPHVRDVTAAPDSPDTLYAALQVGYILKSTDHGAHWELLDKDLDADVHTIVIDPADSRRIVIATGGHDSNHGTVAGRALYASADAGANWTPVAMEFEHDYSVPLVRLPDRPSVLLSAVAQGNPGRWRGRATGAAGLMIRSADGGQSWSAVDLPPVAGLQRAMPAAFAPSDRRPGRVYAGFTSGDVLESSDGGEQWTSLDLALPAVNDLCCTEL
jgi:photosystem II stability/assembly factor-like uncharacterized protein